jgi:anti-sigma factor RsiW
VNCSACSARLSANLDGELSRADALLIAGHLASCASCSALNARLQHVDDVLESLSFLEPSQDFTASVMAKIAEMPAPAAKRFSAWWMGGYTAVAWAAFGALSATHVISPQGVVAELGVFAGKSGVAMETLYKVGAHFHLIDVAVAAVAIEVAMLAVGATVGRKYLPRLGSALLGAQS